MDFWPVSGYEFSNQIKKNTRIPPDPDPKPATYRNLLHLSPQKEQKLYNAGFNNVVKVEEVKDEPKEDK